MGTFGLAKIPLSAQEFLQRDGNTLIFFHYLLEQDEKNNLLGFTGFGLLPSLLNMASF